MNTITAILLALSLSVVSLNSFAATQEEAPPAQLQKDKVPDATSNGNYLEPQPDENSAIQNTKALDDHSKKSTYDKKQSGSKTIKNRGKQTTEKPEDGGMTLEQK